MDKVQKVLKRLESHDPFNQKKRKKIESVEDVKPVRKKDIFYNGYLKPNQRLKLIPSAGTMGNKISYRFANLDRDTRVMGKLMKTALEDIKIQLDDTFILNCYPLGVQLPNHVNAVDISTRVDILKNLIDMTKENYACFLFISQPHFAKHLVDQKVFEGLINKKVAIILGGSWFPKTFSDYLEKHIRKMFNEPLTTISFLGTAETGLGIGYMGSKEIEIRKKMKEPNAPMIFEPNNEEYYIEVIDGELAVTVLDETAYPPLYRYLTNDKAIALPDGKFGLLGFSHDLIVEKTLAYFYKDSNLPDLCTGNFFVEDDKVHFCAKPDQSISEVKRAMEGSELHQYLVEKGRTPFMYTYRHYPYHQSLEKKPRYI